MEKEMVRGGKRNPFRFSGGGLIIKRSRSKGQRSTRLVAGALVSFSPWLATGPTNGMDYITPKVHVSLSSPAFGSHADPPGDSVRPKTTSVQKDSDLVLQSDPLITWFEVT